MKRSLPILSAMLFYLDFYHWTGLMVYICIKRCLANQHAFWQRANGRCCRFAIAHVHYTEARGRTAKSLSWDQNRSRGKQPRKQWVAELPMCRYSVYLSKPHEMTCALQSEGGLLSQAIGKSIARALLFGRIWNAMSMLPIVACMCSMCSGVDSGWQARPG